MLLGRISGQHDSQLTNCQMKWRCRASCSQMSGWHIGDNSVEGSGLPITQAATANQNVTTNIPCKKPQKWLPCLAHKPKCSNRAKDWRTANKQQQQQKLHKTEICLGYASPYSLRSRGQLARFQHHAVILTDTLSMIQKVEWEAQIDMCWQPVIHLQRFMQMYWTCWWSNSHKWLPLWKALSVEELETLPVGAKPRTSQHWLPGGERHGKSKHSTICSKDEKRLSSSRQTLELFQRQCWGNVLQVEWNAQGLCQAYSTILNWTELNCRDVTQLWDIEGWSPGPKINFMVLDFSLSTSQGREIEENANSSYSYKWNSLA